MSEVNKPLVSFGIPTYNRADKLHISVDSILKQNYDNFEIIISDNSSSDNTKEICERYAANDNRIKYYRQETNLGLIGNWDFVHKQAKGKYYMHLADDDWMEEGVLAGYVEFMENNPDYAICSGQFARWRDEKIWFVEKDFNVEQEKPEDRVLHNNKIMIHCGMYYGFVRREYMKKVKPQMMIQHDWLVVSTLAYLGKIKNFDYIGYNKVSGGISSDWSERYAKNVGASRFAAYFSYFVTGYHTYQDILYKNKAYRKTGLLKRWILGLKCWWQITNKHYLEPIQKHGKPGVDVHVITPAKNFMRKYSIYRFIQWLNRLRKRIFGL